MIKFMALVVKKFGGTSLANTTFIHACARMVVDDLANTSIVVVSAMQNATNNLLAQMEHFPNASAAAIDMVLATGEQVACGLMAAAFDTLNVLAMPLCGWQVPIMLQDKQILKVGKKRIINAIKNKYIPVITGFQGINKHGVIETLTRNGSDVTAVAIAAAFGCDCYVYKDVCNIFEYDPKLTTESNNICYSFLNYNDAFKLAQRGQVIHPDAILLAKKAGVKITLLPSPACQNQITSGTVIFKK